MDRTQAAEIQRHMRRAANAINRASEIIFALDEEHQEVLGTPLLEIIEALHFKLLRAVYIRYPELRPPDPGRSRINTARRWKDIVLPESVSETELDSVIFSAHEFAVAEDRHGYHQSVETLRNAWASSRSRSRWRTHPGTG